LEALIQDEKGFQSGLQEYVKALPTLLLVLPVSDSTSVRLIAAVDGRILDDKH